MKKILPLMFILFFSSNLCFAATSTTALKHQLSQIEHTIKNNERKISSIKSSRNLSYNEKKSKIRRLENENYNLKRKLNRVKSSLR